MHRRGLLFVMFFAEKNSEHILGVVIQLQLKN